MRFDPSSIHLLLPPFAGLGADTAVLAAALGHAFQLPSMFLAGRVLRWHRRTDAQLECPKDGFDPAELNRRIERVLTLTVPLALLGLGAILAVDPTTAFASSLGQGVALLVGVELALVARRQLDVGSRAFLHRRSEIVCLLTGLGVLALVHRDAMVSTPLGARLCLFSAALFLVRSILQVTYYARVWPSTLSMRLGSWGLFVLFTLQSLAYLHAAFAPSPSTVSVTCSRAGGHS